MHVCFSFLDSWRLGYLLAYFTLHTTVYQADQGIYITGRDLHTLDSSLLWGNGVV